LYIIGYRNDRDNRYYVPTYIQSRVLKSGFWINFLLDTGASRTQLSWNDAVNYGRINITILPRDRLTYAGLGGAVTAYILQQTTLTFRSNIGKYDIPIGDLSVSDSVTTDGRKCPITSNMLGMDILYKMDLLFENTYAMLRTRF
jgi:hypothetical protein